MRKLKCCLSLLEVSVAIFLTGIILSFLWTFYKDTLFTQKKLQTESLYAHQVMLTKTRLSLLIQEVAQDPTNSISTPDHYLLFSYNHLLDPDPAFRGKISSYLYLDRSNRLCLTSFGTAGKCRQEILFFPLKKFQFELFDLKNLLWSSKGLDTLPLWVHVKLDDLDLYFRSLHVEGATEVHL